MLIIPETRLKPEKRVHIVLWYAQVCFKTLETFFFLHLMFHFIQSQKTLNSSFILIGELLNETTNLNLWPAIMQKYIILFLILVRVNYFLIVWWRYILKHAHTSTQPAKAHFILSAVCLSALRVSPPSVKQTHRPADIHPSIHGRQRTEESNRDSNVTWLLCF